MKRPHFPAAHWSRRNFTRTLLLAGAGCLSWPQYRLFAAAQWSCPLGACSSSDNWATLKKAGADYVEDGVGRLLKPNAPEAEVAKVLAELKDKNTPVPVCNSFLPGELKLVGPDAKPDAVVEYATRAFARAKQVGIGIIVLGSGGARKVPDGFDRAKAEEQFVAILKRLGAAADPFGVTVAMESLNRSETNFGNALRDCLRYINAAGHPRVKLVADLYHMMRENEGPDAILDAGSRIVHVHVAEKAERTPPGTAGDDFKPYLAALKKVGFSGRMSLECRWKDFNAQVGPALAAFKAQITAVASAA
jgi:sugar phosphate isomerase/epimerase